MRFAKMPAVSQQVAEPVSTLYWRISRGEFVPPIKQGERAAAFDLDEVEQIQRARAASASVEDIRALVRKLVAARRMAA